MAILKTSMQSSEDAISEATFSFKHLTKLNWSTVLFTPFYWPSLILKSIAFWCAILIDIFTGQGIHLKATNQEIIQNSSFKARKCNFRVWCDKNWQAYFRTRNSLKSHKSTSHRTEQFDAKLYGKLVTPHLWKKPQPLWIECHKCCYQKRSIWTCATKHASLTRTSWDMSLLRHVKKVTLWACVAQVALSCMSCMRCF